MQQVVIIHIMLISVFLKKKGKLCLEIQLLPYIDF